MEHEPLDMPLDLSEEELIERCLRGEDEAWAILYKRFYDYIFHLVKGKNYRFSLEDTQDITHEVFMDLVKGLPSFRKRSVLKTYIYSLTLNRIRQHYRKYLTVKRGGQVEKTSLEEMELDLADQRINNPEQEILDQDELELVREGVKRLPRELKEVIRLRYEEGLKYREIADYLGIPEGSVGALIQKALMALKNLMVAEPV